MTQFDEMICRWIQDHRQEIIDKWMALIRIPSVRSEAAENAPYGAECDRALCTAASYYGEGFSVKLNRADGYACADYGQGGKLIGLFGHSDVVPVGEGWLYTQPFEPILKEGLLIGRGSFDNKSGVIASWCVLNILKDCRIPLKNSVRAFIGSNEESGMGDITAYVQQERLPDLSLVPDSRFPCSLGEKGILRMWARSKEKLREIADFRGGSAFNTVLDRVTVTMGDGRVYQTEGVSKHAGSPEGSVNAAALAAERLLDSADGKLMAAVFSVLKSPYGEGLGIAHEDPEFGRLTAVNGMVKAEDGHLWVSMDIRYGTSLEPKELERRLSEKWEELGFEIVELNNRPGFSVDPQSPVPALLHGLCREAAGRDMENYRMAGGTYSRYLPNAFTTGTYLSEPSVVAMPAGHGGAHQRDEAIPVEGFFRGVRLLTQAVIACDQLL